MGRFGLAWLGIWMATLVPIQLAIPDQLDRIDHAHRYGDFGWINAFVGFASLISLPLFGALCDRTKVALGRRRVWVLGGVVVMALGLVLTGRQHSWGWLAFWWIVVALGNNAMAAGLTATVADEVPDSQRGVVSGFMFGPQGVGIVVGLLAVEGFEAPQRYVLLAAALLLLTAPFLVGYREAPLAATPPPLTARTVVAGMWISPRRNPDFAWAFGSRLLVNIGNALGTTYLWFFLKDELKVRDPDATLLSVTFIYLIATLAATVVAGPLSDRTGKRRIFVGVAAVFQGVAGILVAAAPSLTSIMVAGALLGVGYGAFIAVDQALVTAVLPNAEDRAKDLGILNVGSVVPQGLGPLLAATIVSASGFSLLFLTCGVATLAGAAMVTRVQSVP